VQGGNESSLLIRVIALLRRSQRLNCPEVEEVERRTQMEAGGCGCVVFGDMEGSASYSLRGSTAVGEMNLSVLTVRYVQLKKRLRRHYYVDVNLDLMFKRKVINNRCR
jgi:hypothetical protein